MRRRCGTAKRCETLLGAARLQRSCPHCLQPVYWNDYLSTESYFFLSNHSLNIKLYACQLWIYLNVIGVGEFPFTFVTTNWGFIVKLKRFSQLKRFAKFLLFVGASRKTDFYSKQLWTVMFAFQKFSITFVRFPESVSFSLYCNKKQLLEYIIVVVKIRISNH